MQDKFVRNHVSIAKRVPCSVDNNQNTETYTVTKFSGLYTRTKRLDNPDYVAKVSEFNKEADGLLIWEQS